MANVSLLHIFQPKHSIRGDSNWLWLPSLWPVRLLVNLFSYATVLLPLCLVARLARRRQRQQQQPAVAEEPPPSQHPSPPQSSTWLALAGCFLSLQVAHLTWGLLQELVMTTEYSGGERFADSQFLVFTNRLLGALVAGSWLIYRGGLGPVSPLDFAHCSVSNVLSAWCQYEALIHVTFPTQVVAKAGKVVPVMLMSGLVSGRSYQMREFVSAGVISAGTALFLLSSSPTATNQTAFIGHRHHQQRQTSSALNGVALLSLYLAFDSFTSTWQSRLFSAHPSLTPLQLMAGTNALSALLTVAAQLQQGSLPAAIAFATRHPAFLAHVVLLSVSSALGQLAIFYTIKRFGPVTFAIMTTTRQGLAILLSCLVFGHPVGAAGWLGVGLVFAALLARVRSPSASKSSARTVAV